MDFKLMSLPRSMFCLCTDEFFVKLQHSHVGEEIDVMEWKLGEKGLFPYYPNDFKSFCINISFILSGDIQQLI